MFAEALSGEEIHLSDARYLPFEHFVLSPGHSAVPEHITHLEGGAF